MPNVLNPRDLVSRPDHMDETVLYIKIFLEFYAVPIVAYFLVV